MTHRKYKKKKKRDENKKRVYTRSSFEIEIISSESYISKLFSLIVFFFVLLKSNSDLELVKFACNSCNSINFMHTLCYRKMQQAKRNVITLFFCNKNVFFIYLFFFF